MTQLAEDRTRMNNPKLPPSEMLTLVETARLGLEARAEIAEAGDPDGGKLSAKDRKRLDKVVAEGRRALDRIVVSILPFLWKHARRWGRMNADVDPAELVSEGTLGVIDAIPKFDASHGVEFLTFASHDINRAMRNRMADSMTMFGGGTMHRRNIVSGVLRRDTEALEEQGLDEEQIVHALAEKYGSTPETMRSVPLLRRGVVGSLDAPLPNGNGNGNGGIPNTLHDFVAGESPSAEEVACEGETARLIEERLAGVHLDARERLILKERLLNTDPPTLQELGDRFGLCRERVRQIEADLLRRLRHVFLDLERRTR